MKPINKLTINFDTQNLKSWLEECDLFGYYHQRTSIPNSPHAEAVDIWARYKDPTENLKSNDWSSFAAKHESVWLQKVPYVKSIAKRLMKHLNGSILGGILITKIPPRGRILPHTDSGWHASFYDKYYIPIKNSSGAKFCFNGINLDPNEGEVYAFRNDVPHWVINSSNEDRISMIICIKQSILSKEGLCLGVS